MNPGVDNYIINGCGRCALGGTPECKVHKWTKELKKLRDIVLASGLTEEIKWGVPCYTFQKSNIVVVAAFKEYCALSFFKGALLQDLEGILTKPGEETQSARLIRFTSLKEIIKIEPVLRVYLYEAMEIEKAGLKVNFKTNVAAKIPEEFKHKLNTMPELKQAFAALTPGRQRGYLLFFSAPKQPQTRIARVEKYVQQILMGKGIND